LKKLNVGILGAGNMGTMHARNLSKLKEVDIVAVCSKPLLTAKKLIKQINRESIPVYDDFNIMLEEAQMDALYICLPPFAHEEQLEKAANKGINIFIEKPIAQNISQAKSMYDAVNKANIKSQVGYHYRFSNPVQKLKNMIENGAAGKPTLFQGRYFCNSLHTEWWRDIKLSGGQIFEQIIHLYDQALYLFGDVETVSAYKDNLCHQNVEGYTAEDTSLSIIRFKSGALGSIAGSNCAVPNVWEAYFTVVCENVTVKFFTPNKAEFIYTNQKEVEKEIVEATENLYFLETKNFINSVLDKEKTVSPIRDGYKGVVLVSCVVESANNNGKPISLQPV